MLSRLLKKPIQVGPSFARKPYIDSKQLAFYQRLRAALPNCTLFPDIALSSLIQPLAGEPKLLRQRQDKLDGRRLAYGVFNDVLELQCVIELTRFGVQYEERAATLALLEETGIKCFSWEHDNLPSTEQIVRAMSAFTNITAARFESAANSVMRAPEGLTWENVMAPNGPAAFSLTVEEVIRLTPNGHVKALYPHIWERICLFCNEPHHFERYLSSLSIQDRGDKRNGFPQGVIVELADLQGANARFMPAQTRQRGGWNDTFVNR